MSSSGNNHSELWPRLSVIDFLQSTESLQTDFPQDQPLPSLGVSDLDFVISAPQDYCSPANGARVTLYFDNADCVRTLPKKVTRSDAFVS